MSSKLNIFGSFIGVVLVIAGVGWFGANHYFDTRDERLPIKTKQALARFQKTLPIEIGRGLMLEKFNFTRSSINFTFKINKKSFPIQDHLIMQEHFKSGSLVWLCFWRERFLGRNEIKIGLSFIDQGDVEIASVVNKDKDCDNPIPIIPKKLAS